MNSFGSNACYSDVFEIVSTSVANAAKTGDKSDLESVSELTKALPFYGYESDCEKIRQVALDFRKN